MANSIASILARVKEVDGCWVWQGATYQGYGKVRFQGRTWRAHRLVYKWLRDFYITQELDHLCRNRRCLNPEHLEPVTTRTNTLRGEGVTARNARKATCPRGHPLTPENLYPRTERQQRDCKTCGREQTRRRRAALGAVGLAARVAYNRAWRAKKRAESSIG